jgi:hypothetical protein
MIELTQQQRLEIQAEPSPPRLVDPVTGQEFVLIRAEIYAEWAAQIDENVDPQEIYSAIDQTFAPGWEDPRMADYDRYEELKP